MKRLSRLRQQRRCADCPEQDEREQRAGCEAMGCEAMKVEHEFSLPSP
jgi:hypothetical protein